MDYSSSGLENPLTHVFLALFLLKWASGKKDYFGFFLLFSLLYLNRPDSIIFVVPPLLFLIYADFDVAQKRERIVIVGVREDIREKNWI